MSYNQHPVRSSWAMHTDPTGKVCSRCSIRHDAVPFNSSQSHSQGLLLAVTRVHYWVISPFLVLSFATRFLGCCRDGRWWEQSAFQLKIFLLLLVVVNGRPRGNYVQTLLFVGLLFFEFAYQVYVRPHRFPHVQHVREALVALLLFSVFTSFFFDDYEGQLPEEGLKALAAFIAAANVAFTIYVLYLICRTYLLEFIAYVVGRVQDRTSRHFSPVVELASAVHR